MARKPKLRVNAQTRKGAKVISPGGQGGLSALEATRAIKNQIENAKHSDQKTIKIPSPTGADRNQILYERGISVVRPEIIAATEFIPLVRDNDPSDATFTLGKGDKDYKIDITNASRLMEMQLAAQSMLLFNINKVMSIYADDFLPIVLSLCKNYLSSSYAPVINLSNFSTMKRKIKSAIETASFAMPKDLSEADLATGRLRKISEEKSKIDKLALRFKKLNPEYSNMIVDYLTRDLIVNYTIKFLSEMAKTRVATVKLFNVINVNEESMKDISGRGVQKLIQYFRRNSPLPPMNPVTMQPIEASRHPIASIPDYVKNNLNTDMSEMLKPDSGTRNLLLILKSLSADMQLIEKKRVRSSESDYTHVPSVAFNIDNTDNTTNGECTYIGFNCASVYGGINKKYNFVTSNNAGEKFSEDAYSIVRKIVGDNNRNFNDLIGDEQGLTDKRIDDHIVPLFAKVLMDLTMHNNNIETSNYSSNIVNSAEFQTSTLESFCNQVIYKKNLDAKESLTSIALSRNSNSDIVNKIVKKATFGNHTVLPLERESGAPNFEEEKYLSGPNFMFDDGIREIAEGSQNSFSKIKNYSNQYNTAITNLIKDFSKIRGIGVSNNPNLVDPIKMFDNLNDAIADKLKEALKSKSQTLPHLFMITDQCKEGDYMYTTFLTAMMLQRQNDALWDEGLWYSDEDTALYNAFRHSDLTKSPRARTFQKREGKNEQKKHRKRVSLRKYCTAHMFLQTMLKVHGIPKSGGGDGLGDDFDIKRKHVKPVNKTIGTKGILTKEDALQMLSDVETMTSAILTIEDDDYFKGDKRPWSVFGREINNIGRDSDISGNYDFFNLDFLYDQMSKKAKKSLEDPKIISPNLSTSPDSRKTFLANGGGSIMQFGVDKDVFSDRPGTLSMNTNRKRTYSGLKSTHDLKQFALINYVMSIFSKMYYMRVNSINDNDADKKVKGLKYFIYKFTIETAIDALKGRPFSEEKHSRKVYDDIRKIIRSVKNEIFDNNKKCIQHLLVLKGHSSAINSQILSIDRFLDGSVDNNDYRQAFESFQQSRLGGKLLSFLSPSFVASMKYSQLSLMKGSNSKMHGFIPSGITVPSTDFMTRKQMTNMITYFSKPNVGYLSREQKSPLNARKTALHIGIPAGMLENLQYEAISRTGDNLYQGSNIIMISIYKKDILNKSCFVYPKTFVFDTSRFFLDNIQGYNPEHMKGVSILSPRELKNKTVMYKINGYGDVYELKPGKAYSESIQNLGYENNPRYSENFLDDIFENHMMDHYLKTYSKLMTGLDFKEYIFQLTPESSIRNGPDGSNLSVLNQMITNNERVFPEAATDITAARELDKINRGISNTLFFNSERYMKASMFPNAFDRVFSLFINERDFVHASRNIAYDLSDEKYGGRSKPRFATKLSSEARSIKKPIATMRESEKYYNKTLDKDYPQVYMYYAEISIMKRIEKPDY